MFQLQSETLFKIGFWWIFFKNTLFFQLSLYWLILCVYNCHGFDLLLHCCSASQKYAIFLTMTHTCVFWISEVLNKILIKNQKPHTAYPQASHSDTFISLIIVCSKQTVVGKNTHLASKSNSMCQTELQNTHKNCHDMQSWNSRSNTSHALKHRLNTEVHTTFPAQFPWHYCHFIFQISLLFFVKSNIRKRHACFHNKIWSPLEATTLHITPSFSTWHMWLYLDASVMTFFSSPSLPAGRESL